MSNFPYRLTIRERLVLLCLGVATPLLMIGGFALWKEYTTLRSEGQSATRFQTSIAVRTLKEWVGAQLDTVKAVASLSQLQNLKADATMRVLTTAIQAQRNWSEIFIITPAGKVLNFVTESPKPTATQIVFADKDFAQTVLGKRRVAISGYVKSPLTGSPALLAGAPIVSGDEIKGAIIVAIKPQAIFNLFQGLGETEGTVFAVSDANKRVITRTINNDFWQGKDFSNAHTVIAAEHKQSGSIEGVGIADQVSRAWAFERIPDLNWLVEVGVPTRTIYGAAYHSLWFMLALAISAIGASLLLAFLVTSHFTRNINLLVKEALALGRGDLSKRVNVSATDELGTLAQAFNTMASKLEIDQEHKFMVEKLSESIRQSLDLDQILNTTVRELGRALEASRCCLALIDEANRDENADTELIFNHVWYDPLRGGMPLGNRSIVVTPKSVMNLMLKQGSILSLDVLEENSQTPLFENDNNSPDDWKSIRSLMACPISGDSGPVGLILVHQCDQPRMWTDSELELVEAVARHVVLAMHHARLYNRTKNMAEQEMLINHIVRSIRSSLELDTILNTVTEELCIALQADRCQIAQPREEGPLVITHEFHASDLDSARGINMYSEPIDFRPERANVIPYPGRNYVLGIDLNKIIDMPSPQNNNNNGKADAQIDGNPASAKTVREAPIAVVNDAAADSRTMPFREFINKSGSRSMIAAPLISENRLVGLLIVHQCKKPRIWNTREVQLVAAIADQLAIAVTHAHLFAQVKHQAITDGLTGLYNHIYFKKRLAEEIRLAQRKGTSCSLLMIDLDKLKQINDNFGHPVGDAAIRHVATILKNLLRSGDTAARYGGEEFGVILPETSLLEAALIADRLCAQISSTHVPGLGRVTASIGAASFPKQASDVGDLVEKADKALYSAKNSGRNQIWIYEDTANSPNTVEGGIPQRLSLMKTSDTQERPKRDWNG